MPASFLFYDLETTGISARKDRIMQFGAQRTNLELEATSQPVNINIRLTPDVLPAPEAILTSQISPLDNQEEAISEAEFTSFFNEQLATEGTIFTGFNNLRFDDEFIRYNNYRNFYDAYAWHWQKSSSRWDLLDVVRITRALRPAGIIWPLSDEGKPSNRLELLTQANSLPHANAHDALSDALATIEVAKLIKRKQPKLFSYLLALRSKQSLIKLIQDSDTLVYCSSHYPSEFLHTSIVALLDLDKGKGTALVFDLRENVSNFIDLGVDELTELWDYDPDKTKPRLPVKTIKLNRCPALAPLSVLDKPTTDRLKLNLDEINKNRRLLLDNKEALNAKLKQVVKQLDRKRDERQKSVPRIPPVDERLYDSFIPRADTLIFPKARDKARLNSDFNIKFEDNRLDQLYSLYRARNYPDSLTEQEKANWSKYIKDKLFSGDDSNYEVYKNHLSELIESTKNVRQLKLLKDLDIYSQIIVKDYANV